MPLHCTHALSLCPSVSLSHTQVLMGNLQINASLNIVFDVPWPPIHTQFIAFLSIFKLDIFKGMSFAAPCLHSSHFMSLATFIATPIVLVVVFLLAFVVVIVMSRVVSCCPSQKRRKIHKLVCCRFTVESARTSMMKILIVVVLFIYPTICSKVFITFKCVSVGATGHFMVADMSVACYEPEWLVWAFISGISMAVYIVGIPVGLVLLLAVAQRRGTLQYPRVTMEGDGTPAEVHHAVGRTKEFFSNRLRYGNSALPAHRCRKTRECCRSFPPPPTHHATNARPCPSPTPHFPHQCTTNTSLSTGGSSSAARCAR